MAEVRHEFFATGCIFISTVNVWGLVFNTCYEHVPLNNVHDLYWTSFYPPCSTSSEFRRSTSSISVLCIYGAYLFYGRTDRRTDCSFPEMVQWNFTVYTSFRSCNQQLRWEVLNDPTSFSDWQESVGLGA